MFLIPKVFYIPANRTEGYRSINIGSVKEIASSAFYHGVLIVRFWEDNIILIASFTIMNILLLYTYKARHSETVSKVLLSLCIIGSSFYFVNVDETKGALLTLFTVIKCGLPIIVFVIIMISNKDGYGFAFNILLIILFFSCIAPFLIVSPYPRRVLLLPYIIMCAIVLYNLDHCFGLFSPGIIKIIQQCLLCITVVLCVSVSMVFRYINTLEAVRNQHIVEAMRSQEKSIELFQIPYAYAFWDGCWAYHFHFYYNKPGDIVFDCVEYNDWMDKYNHQEFK